MIRETYKYESNMSVGVKAFISILLLILSVYLMRPLFLNFLSRSVATLTTEYVSGSVSMAFITVPNQEAAKKLAHGLVEGKLAACVNIIPGISSVYLWEGKIEEDQEILLMLKTRTTKIPEITEFVKQNHPFDVPEVISSPIDAGNAAYMNWILEVVPVTMGTSMKNDAKRQEK